MSEATNHIYYENHGNGSPVILIHGMGASLRQWDFLIPDLLNAGFSTFALDLPGHGNSAKPVNKHHYHIDVFFAQIDKWINTIDIQQPFFLIGHSMGGYLSLLYSLRRSHKIQAMVLSDPYYKPTQLSPLLQVVLRNPRTGIEALRYLPSWIVDFILIWMEKTRAAISRDVRQQLSNDFKSAAPSIFYTARTTRDLTSLLPQVNIPTLILWGRDDLTLEPKSFQTMVEAMPYARSHIFSESGHVPHLSHTPSFNHQVLNFFKEIRSK